MIHIRARRSLFCLLIVQLLAPVAHAAEVPLTFNDLKPQRYELTARASVLDSRAKPHPELDFVFE